MPIHFTCPHCGLVTDVSDEYAGRTGPCAGCGRPISIPPLAPQWRCPRCSEALAAGAPVCGNCGLALHHGRPAGSVGDDAVVRMLIPVGRSGLAIAAGYAGLFAVLVFPAPIAVLLGILAVRDIRKNPHKHGMGRAVFGLVMGVLFTVLLAVLLVVAALQW